MSLFASVLHLDRRAVRALRVTDPYSLHRVVYSLFDDVRSESAKNDGASSGILFADQGGDALGRKVLMLSNRAPLSMVEGQYGQVLTKTIGDDFLNYTAYRFKVVINPVRRDNTSHKRVPVKGREAIAAWFCERAPRWGFSVQAEQLVVDDVSVLQFQEKQQRAVTLAQAHLRGVLTVTDATLFKNSFARGLGHGRAFGCGLLQIVPVIENPFA